MAFSLASAPALVKNTLLKPSGASSTIRFRRFAAGEVGGGGWSPLFQLGFHRRQHARMLIANVDVDQLAAEIQVSIALRNPSSQPFAPAITSGCKLPCIDHE